MARAVAEKGFARTVVADVLAGAGVSRETFYEQFRDKEDCFVAAYDAAVETLLAIMAKALAGAQDAEPIERFDLATAAYLELMARDESIARVFLIDVYAAGARALERRLEVFERFVGTVAEIFGANTERERLRVEALMGALSSMVTLRVAAGKTAELPTLREPIRAVARSLCAAA